MVVVTFFQSLVRTGGIESGASIYIQVLPLCASVRVPLIDTLDIMLLKFLRKHSSQHQSFNPLIGLYLLKLCVMLVIMLWG